MNIYRAVKREDFQQAYIASKAMMFRPGRDRSTALLIFCKNIFIFIRAVPCHLAV
jgi:hypothetical protein